MNKLTFGSVARVTVDETGEAFTARVVRFAKNSSGQPVAILKVDPTVEVVEDMRTRAIVALDFVSLGPRYHDFPIDGPFDSVIPGNDAMPANLVRLIGDPGDTDVISEAMYCDMGAAVVRLC
jgi:hypothetical protein